jgi:hypothetical protein
LEPAAVSKEQSKNMKTLHLVVAAVCLCASSAFAQTEKFYKLDFVVKEVENGKPVNIRAYSSILQSGQARERGSIRAGGRVPFTSGGNVQYYDLGVNFDFHSLREIGERVALDLSLEVSSNMASESSGTPPIIRNNKWSAVVAVNPGKATVIHTADDPTSKRQLQLELTATLIK